MSTTNSICMLPVYAVQEPQQSTCVWWRLVALKHIMRLGSTFGTLLPAHWSSLRPEESWWTLKVKMLKQPQFLCWWWESGDSHLVFKCLLCCLPVSVFRRGGGPDVQKNRCCQQENHRWEDHQRDRLLQSVQRRRSITNQTVNSRLNNRFYVWSL